MLCPHLPASTQPRVCENTQKRTWEHSNHVKHKETHFTKHKDICPHTRMQMQMSVLLAHSCHLLSSPEFLGGDWLLKPYILSLPA